MYALSGASLGGRHWQGWSAHVPRRETHTVTQSIEMWTLVRTILASSMAFIDSSALNVVLSNLQSDFGASGAQLLWIVNAYLLMLAALILTGGALGDRFGRKRIFSMGIALFAVASLACGLAPTIELLLVGRVIQGIGGALMVPGSLAIITATSSGGGAAGPSVSGPPPARSPRWRGQPSAASSPASASGGSSSSSMCRWRSSRFSPSCMCQRHATRRRRATSIWGTLLVVLGLFGVTFGAIGLGNGSGATGANPLDVLSLVVGHRSDSALHRRRDAQRPPDDAPFASSARAPLSART